MGRELGMFTVDLHTLQYLRQDYTEIRAEYQQCLSLNNGSSYWHFERTHKNLSRPHKYDKFSLWGCKELGE